MNTHRLSTASDHSAPAVEDQLEADQDGLMWVSLGSQLNIKRSGVSSPGRAVRFSRERNDPGSSVDVDEAAHRNGR